MRLRTLAAASILALTTVGLTGCIVYAGPPTTEQRDVESDVHAVVLSTGGDLVVTLGSTPSLSVTAPEGALDRLLTTSSNGVLTLDRIPGPWFIRGDISYELTVTSFDDLHVKGSGDVTADFSRADSVSVRISGSGDVDARGIDADDVSVRIDGSGDISLRDLTANTLDVNIKGSGDISPSGTVQTQSVLIEGSGNYHAESLQSRDATVRIQGAGDVRVEATGTLDASIDGSGSIRYRGNPEVRSSIQGSGDISEF